MKFGKSLGNQIEETLPEWRDKFLSYKDLKKRLKLIGLQVSVPERPGKRPRLDTQNDAPSAVIIGGDHPRCSSCLSAAITPEEEDFLNLLEAELEKFNSFFVEKEEEYIIRQKELQDRVARSAELGLKEEMMVYKEIVDFHGEMVLLENYSALNYTGLVKILKKYDKRTGALIRLPFIQKVLQQPFFTIDLLHKLVKECELTLNHLLPKKKEPSISGEAGSGNGGQCSGGEPKFGVPELEEIEYMESLFMKSSVAALRALKEIRSGSSTVSVFSLPSLQSPEGMEDRWNNAPVVQQAAK
ncbi:SPX domain-containing protein 1 [Platanthera guangdongensis]|uniref:SPX domain-containing protein 1 n=1 Tax=Platanthera guangdongensis TaxID=2320717 RepID=A0ABR2LF85_9ASPA